MPENPDLIATARSMVLHSAARQALVAENIANADTPGFRARDLPGFAATWAAAGEGAGRDRPFRMAATRPDHLAAHAAHRPVPEPIVEAGPAAPNGNSVSLEREMVRAVEIRQQHDTALAVYRTSLDLLRTALGRGR